MVLRIVNLDALGLGAANQAAVQVGILPQRYRRSSAQRYQRCELALLFDWHQCVAKLLGGLQLERAMAHCCDAPLVLRGDSSPLQCHLCKQLVLGENLLLLNLKQNRQLIFHLFEYVTLENLFQQRHTWPVIKERCVILVKLPHQ